MGILQILGIHGFTKFLASRSGKRAVRAHRADMAKSISASQEFRRCAIAPDYGTQMMDFWHFPETAYLQKITSFRKKNRRFGS